jgi:hypothetical protein
MESENVGIETLTECDYGAISPEALPGEAWVKQTTWDDSRELCESNGNTDAPPSDGVVVWGLRSIETGRWISISDVYGEQCLLVFRTRELAERYRCDSNEVVWMRPAAWWRKVEDAAKTGYPPRVNLLYGIENGHTDERTWSCKTLAQEGGLEAFIQNLHDEIVKTEKSTRI